MTSKISRSILLVSLLVFLATLSIIMVASYSYFSGVQKEQLAIESELAAQGVALSGGIAQQDGLILVIETAIFI